jgi:hypothetical protein
MIQGVGTGRVRAGANKSKITLLFLIIDNSQYGWYLSERMGWCRVWLDMYKTHKSQYMVS